MWVRSYKRKDVPKAVALPKNPTPTCMITHETCNFGALCTTSRWLGRSKISSQQLGWAAVDVTPSKVWRQILEILQGSDHLCFPLESHEQPTPPWLLQGLFQCKGDCCSVPTLVISVCLIIWYLWCYWKWKPAWHKLLVNCHVGTGSWIWVLCKISLCS